MDENIGSIVYDIVANDMTEIATVSASEGMVRAGLVIGAAITGIAASADIFIDKYNQMMKSIDDTSLETGIATQDLQNLSMAMSNAKDSTDEVNSTMEALGKAGITDKDQMKEDTEAALQLANALDTTGDNVVQSVVPALQAYGLTVDDLSDHEDTITSVMKNTQMTMQQFDMQMQRAGPDAEKLGISFDQMGAIIELMAQKGVPAKKIMPEISQAMKEAKGNTQEFYSILGITGDQLDTATDKLDHAKGITMEYSTVAETHVSIMQQMSNAWDKVEITVGGALAPFQGVFTVLTAVGPILTGVNGAVMLYNTLMANKATVDAADTVAVATESASYDTLTIAEAGATTALGDYVAAEDIFEISAEEAAIAADTATSSFGTMTLAEDGATASAGLLDAALDANPIGILVLALAALAAALIYLNDQFGIVDTAVSTFVEGCQEWWDILNDVYQIIMQVLKADEQLGAEAGQFLGSIFGGLSGQTQNNSNSTSTNDNSVNIGNVSLSQGYTFNDMVNDTRSSRVKRGYKS